MGEASLGGSQGKNSCERFRHCGMQATVAEPSEDPFADLDENEAQLEDFVEQLHPDDCMTVSEHTEADNKVATCTTFERFEN